MDWEDATQATQNTQGVVDPRRMGRNNSGLSEADISDVICILHPCSPAAFKIVASTAERTPYNVLQNNGFNSFDDALSQSVLEEQETFIIDKNAPYQAMDLALRFSAPSKNPKLGFVFGRNDNMCDIVLAADTFKRVSNMHFSIFINNSGVLMLQDMSTNGTVVDDVLLKGKATWHTRMLNNGSMIQILSPKHDEIVKFIVRVPSREGHFEEYEARFQAYMQNVAAAEARARADNLTQGERLMATNTKTQNGSIKAPLIQNQFGMHWSGGDRYNVVGLIGKGAFATVYQLATKSEGQLFAAKELEKRKFMKNGILDRKLDNEMQIMKAVSHPNIVQYVDYQDHANHMYIIMEFVPCGDLQKYLSAQGVLTEDLGKNMAAQVLDALSYLHKKKITHRDIKPDNILISNLDEDQFTIKLSDFGLSKVVKDNETFLKTFCGTLLYCAPEVFPHYDTHVAGKSNKRPRRGAAPQSTRFHGYSQSVDIWSFGAVLWYSLCQKPPFEGVADNTGRGMFEKIMATPLDVKDLKARSVSGDAIALLISMLNTDPASRPSASQCLASRWLDGVAQAVIPDMDIENEGLLAIQEEDEGAEPAEEPDVSGLSLDRGESNPESLNEISIGSGSLEFLDPRQSKRFKPDAYRDQEKMFDSSGEMFHLSGVIPIALQTASGRAPDRKLPARRLFGEITQSALNESGVLGRGAFDAVASQDSRSSSKEGRDIHEADNSGAMASPSLLGAESMVREMTMDSPKSDGSHQAEVNEPVTPNTPAAFRIKSRSQGDDRPGIHSEDDITPKQPQRSTFNRRIEIPIPASFYYDPTDPETHNVEYASEISGHDYTSRSSHGEQGGDRAFTSLPTTAISGGSTTENDEDNEAETRDAAAQAPQPSQFLKPPPRLGKLTSTLGSFTALTIPLSRRLTTWGRAPTNTNPHDDKFDTRIPKRGILIWHHAKDIDRYAESDTDAWLKLPDLHCVISTESSRGIYVNGILLKRSDPVKQTSYLGRIFTGDEIVIVPDEGAKSGLKFSCEFYHGEARNVRPPGEPRFVVETIRMTPPSSAAEKEGNGKSDAKTAVTVEGKENVGAHRLSTNAVLEGVDVATGGVEADVASSTLATG